MENLSGTVRHDRLAIVRPAEKVLASIAMRQDGVVTTQQALAAGLSHRHLRTAVTNGWTQPGKGVFMAPDPADPFRAHVRAALLAFPGAAASGATAARVRDLWGLPLWTPAEPTHVILPAGMRRAQRPGMRLSFGLQPGETVIRKGFAVVGLHRTVGDVCLTLPLDDLVCLLDSALRKGWTFTGYCGRKAARLAEAMPLTDARSESALETKIRLLFVRAGMPPETLQLELFTEEGVNYARLDLAWPSRRVAVEADGRGPHDQPEALYHDRWRQNRLSIGGWTLLRFTWSDLMRRPHWVIAQLRAALEGSQIRANSR